MRTPTLDPAEFLGAQAIQDPYPLYKRLRERAPVHRIGESHFYAVVGRDAVGEAIDRPGDFSSNLTALITYTPETGLVSYPMDRVGGATQVLATADDPAHAVHRKLLVPQLAAKRVRATEAFIVDTFDGLWERGLRGGRIEWMGALADRLPMMIVLRLIGAPEDDAERLIEWAYVTTQLLDGLRTADQMAVSARAAAEMSAYILDLLRSTPAAAAGASLAGELAAAIADGRIDEPTALPMMLTLFSAAGESTAALLGSAMSILATVPGLQRRLRERPELLTPFIEETLRFESPFRGHYRHVLADTELGGIRLPAGGRLLLLWGAANHDPEHFDRADEFRLDRADTKGHLTFGRGAHFCVGAALARLEAATVLAKVLERTSWIEAAEVGPWLPSILVRRRAHLQLTVR
ncbi:cytochrome P450 [Mycolicibacterium palauense]|uniref:cytochrome P450 n=1 Tax=Mycolicibacterium palauense TaxID=2034511 RepID=UPI001FEA59FB|nr:cytochrome P450 [Mycolicibacterium palauense]